MLRRKLKDIVKDAVTKQDRGSEKHQEAIRRMIRNNKTISDHAKHLPKRTE